VCTKDNDNLPPFQSAINLYIQLFEPAPLGLMSDLDARHIRKWVATYASLLREKHRNIESTSDGA
jgi:hypothetical protein